MRTLSLFCRYWAWKFPFPKDLSLLAQRRHLFDPSLLDIFGCTHHPCMLTYLPHLSHRLKKMSSTTTIDPGASLPARVESDSMGELSIAEGRLWGAQTQRSLKNFPIGGPESKSEFV